MNPRCGIRQRVLVLVLASTLLAVGMSRVSEAQAKLTPTQVVVDVLDTVKEIKKSDADESVVLTPEERKRNGQLSRRVNSMLDIRGISEYALVQHWEEQDPQGRTTFVSLFTELLEKVAYTNAGTFLQDLSVSVRKEKVLSDKAMVYTSVFHEEEGRIDIDFKLCHLEDSWLVQDIYLDGVSLARNLRTQCLKIIRDHSFQELLARMREKIEEEDTEDLKEVTGRN
ncbi:MAG: phospholipid-binding protein MlaC [Syntrophobacteria bacterium]